MGVLPKVRRFFIGEKPSTQTEARLLRKIDTVLLAYLCLSQFMNFLDRQNITNAYVSGMAEDVGFKGLDYNITQTIFQVGYIVGGIPQSLIVSSNRIRLSIWLPLCCMGWAMTNLGVAFSTQVYQIQICRFFMALFESVSFAGGHYVLGIWYKPSELGKRAALLTASQNTGGLFAGIMQGAIYSTLNGRLGMAGWRWMILVNTLMTVPVALFGFLTFPDTPQDCRRRWLSEEELKLAIDRVPERVQTKLSWTTFKRIFLEWRFWVFTFQFSFNTIMEWSGLFAPMQLWMRWTGWYTVPQINYYPLGTTAIIITSTFFFALWSDYTQSRWWVNCVMATFSGIAATILLVWDVPTAAKYFAWYLGGMGYIGQATNFAWANEMCRDNDQLRAYTLYAMVYGSNVSIAIFGIAFFPVTDLPRFTKGYATSLAICILSPPLAYAIHRACGARARRLKREAEAAGTIEYQSADAPAAEAQYEAVDEKKGESVIPEEGDVKVTEVPVSMVR